MSAVHADADLRPVTEAAESMLGAGPGTDGVWDARAWAVLQQSGLTTIELPESAGGGGGTLREMAEVVRVAGARSARLPLAETALVAGWLLHGAGLAVPPGPLSAAWDTEVTARPGEGGWLLAGTARRVPYARVCAGVALLATGPDGPLAVLVDPARCRISEGVNLAGEPRDDLDLTAAPALSAAPVGASTGELLVQRAALSRIVLTAGAAQTVLDLVLRHVAEREQFGRPIGRFQAVQHLVAELAGEVATVAVCAESALLAAAGDDPSYAATAVASAKVVSAQASGRICAVAHQLFGGIGVTREHALHRSTTRLWSWRDEAGTEGRWADLLAARALDPAAPTLWQQLVGL